MLSAPPEVVRAAIERSIRGAHSLALASSLVGIALILTLAVPAVTTVVFATWGGELSGPSTGSEWDGLGVVLGYIGSNLVALAIAAVLAIAALVLDILMLVRTCELLRRRVRGAVALLLSLAAATGVLSTPVLGALSFVPAGVMPGRTEAIEAALLGLGALAYLMPLMGRLLMIGFAWDLAPAGQDPRRP